MTATADATWWSALAHGGLLIAPSRLAEHFPDEAEPLEPWIEDQLRSALDRHQVKPEQALSELLDRVLEGALGLGRPHHSETGLWEKGSNVPPEYGHRDAAGTVIKPQRVWRGTAKDRLAETRAELPVFVDDADRIGVHRGRRAHARVVEWLRAMDRPLALLTNGRQWRLVHVGLDSDAWAESDVERWFEEGGEGEALRGLRTLLRPSSLIPAKDGERAPLLAAIEATRRGQSELSAALGENVRKAVEVLIAAHGPALADLLAREATDGPPEGARPVRSQDLYVAACRMVMRLVVLHFAEAREGLLPVDGATYRESYSLEGLRTQLERAAGSSAKGRMKERGSAWPRLLALFRLIAAGSTHPDLPIPRYGGGLFTPGDPASTDGVSRAMAVLESAIFDGDDRARVSDAQVHEILRLLTRSRIKVRQGNRNTWVVAPVDFSDLSSEYIGILYEGLLDFELKRVEGDAPVVFLDLGDQPALALDRLEQMDDKAIVNLVEKIGKPSKADSGDDDDAEVTDDEEGDDEEQASASSDEDESEDSESIDDDAEADEPDDVRGQARERAIDWARKAVEAGKLVRKSSSKDPAKLREREAKVDALADRLIARTVLPDEWFLVRFGGTRKGSGTYYTKPQLAIPTVHRTLRPLCYDPPTDDTGEPNVDAPTAEWTPKPPEALLALKVCDPACGSGSFLVAALRFLTDALFRSLQHHGRIAEQGDGAVVRLAAGDPALRLEDELLPTRPDDDQFEPRLRARLRRHVVERCIHGVDLDPLAVDLCRLALWIETLDRRLPFTFLDHRVKCGNALIGCWFDRFRDYPVLAWERKGGDEAHSRGVHFGKATWDKAIRSTKGSLKTAVLDWLNQQTSLFDEADGVKPEQRQRELAAVIERLHALPVHEVETRESLYRTEVAPAIEFLRTAFDIWCAIWFWPGDALESAPMPADLGSDEKVNQDIVSHLRSAHRFFHWELEFPDVFDGPTSGFDAVIGNPPWETEQPVSKEFFSNLDPLYRAYGKQEALARQQELFTDSAQIERDWLDYVDRFKALANWYKHSGAPFGDPEEGEVTFSFGRGKRSGTDEVHRGWRARRAKRTSFSDPRHPFRHQGGGKGYTYRLFLELGWSLGATDERGHGGARLGLIVPSGLYTDKGSMELRELFLDEGRWEWLFAFENRRKIFDIHRSFKFCPLIVAKAGRTEAVRAAFMRHDLDEWSRAETVAVPYLATQVHRFSPNSRSFLEVSDKRDLEILEKIYSNSVPLGDDSDDGWGVEYRQGDFNMTSDSKLFQPRPKWEAKGYEPDEYSRWLLTDWHPRTADSPAPLDAPRHEIEPGILLHRDGQRWTHADEVRDMALPLYQGVMVQLFDPRPKGYLAGAGNRASWQKLEPSDAYIAPQFLMAAETYSAATRASRGLKLGFRDIARSTDRRTFICALIPDLPVGNKVPVLGGTSPTSAIELQAGLGSLLFDWTVRRRLAGTSLNWFVVEELPPPLIRAPRARSLVLQQNALLPSFAPFLVGLSWLDRKSPTPLTRAARSEYERRRVGAMLEATALASAGLDEADAHHILRDSSRPEPTSRLDPRGFWRVDKDLDPELRHTVLTQVAFADLQSDIRDARGNVEQGIERFLARNDGEGWMLPETLRLADYDLGHDDRAKHPQPVAERLGPRFYDWQLAQTPEQSWRECEIHAANLTIDHES